MENFVVSARKYRPATFSSVVGQPALVATLKNAIISNRLAHAYLFCGPRGVGKTTCARIFAKTINCQNLTSEHEACNECESCKTFNEHRSYNIHELDAASNNSVDDIRQLIDQVRIPPQVGKYSVFIIDEVHMLSSAAFNAFLKTLEEPPSHAIFILATTEKYKILPTILSRCQIYDFNRISVSDTVAHLQYVAEKENIEAEAEALNVIAQKSDGGMRDALSIFDQVVSFCGKKIVYKDVIENLNVLDYNYYFRLVQAFMAGDVPQSMIILDEILNKGFDGGHFVSGLCSHFRDVMVCKDPQTIPLLEVGASIGEAYKTQAANCDLEFLYKALRIANECDLNYRQSKNKRLLIEIMLIRLCQLSDKKKNSLNEDDNNLLLSCALAQVFTKEEKVTAAISPSVESLPPAIQKTDTVAKKTIIQPSTIRHRSFSINAFGKETQEEIKESDTSARKRNETFTENQLCAAWYGFMKTVSGQIHLQQTMKASVPRLKSDTQYEFVVANSYQEKELIDVYPKLRQYMADVLKNDFVEVKIVIDDSTTSTKMLTPSEIFVEKQKTNESFRNLVAVLNLEIK